MTKIMSPDEAKELSDKFNAGWAEREYAHWKPVIEREILRGKNEVTLYTSEIVVNKIVEEMRSSGWHVLVKQIWTESFEIKWSKDPFKWYQKLFWDVAV